MRLRKEVIRDARSQRSRHGFWERRLARNPPSSSAFLHIDVAASLEKAPNTAPGQEAQETLQSQVEDPQCTTTNARTLRGRQEEGTCVLLLCLYSAGLLLMDSFYAGKNEEGKCSDYWTS